MNTQFYNALFMSFIFACILHSDIACSGSDGAEKIKKGRATKGYRPPVEAQEKAIAEIEYALYTPPSGELKFDSVRKMFYYGEPLPVIPKNELRLLEAEEIDVDLLALETSGSEEEVNYDPIRKQYYAGPPLPITRISDTPNVD